MKFRHSIPILLLALAVAPLALAAVPPSTGQRDIVVLGTRASQVDTLARVSRLSPNDVKMVLGIRRPGYTEYVLEYEHAHRQLRGALGSVRYDALFARDDAGSLDARLAEAVAGL